jgi:hypothetical protein
MRACHWLDKPGRNTARSDGRDRSATLSGDTDSVVTVLAVPVCMQRASARAGSSALGHTNGKHAAVVIPGPDPVVSWHDTTLDWGSGNPLD